MKEEILIRGKVSRQSKVILAVVCSLFVLNMIFILFSLTLKKDFTHPVTLEHIEVYPFDPMIIEILSTIEFILFMFCIILFYTFIKDKKNALIVTNMRVVGVASTRKFDIPIDSISSVERSGMHGFRLISSSGVYRVQRIDNTMEIIETINGLLKNRCMDKLELYKKLLERGEISENAYNSKRDQILGL